MLFKIDPRIFRDYPGVVIGIVAAHDINNKDDNQEVRDLLIKSQKHITSVLQLSDLAEHQHIIPWRNAYKKFGAKPKKHLSSIENLVQRILKRQSLRSINTLVDLYNVISLRYLIPAGGEDLDTIDGNIELTIAGDHEKPVVLLGDQQARTPQSGEVIYKDNNGAICRRWNWKEADRTKLTKDTRDAFLVLEALPPVKKEILEIALHELAWLIEKYCGGSVTVALLDEDNQQEVLKESGSYVPLEPKKQLSVPDFLSQEIFYHKQKVDAGVPEVKHDESVSREHQDRLDKVEKMQAAGIEPWPPHKEINATCKDVLDEYSDEAESREYNIAGRIIALREHGKTVFCHIQDRSGKIQVYIKKDNVGEEKFNELKHFIDIGDTVWFAGHSFKTKTGEITLKVDNFTLLSKCLHPLPEKFHGLADIEIIYRQRYLDLISNAESRDRFKKRSQIIKIMRDCFNEHGFMEVETPMLHPIPGGAVARPFVTHHNALDLELYLRIAPELYLKRLVIGSFERVYEIGRCFRNEGISTKHNPEFTLAEFYIAHKDYHFMMDFVEKILRKIVMEVYGSLNVQFGNQSINFEQPFKKISMKDAVMEYGGYSESALSEKNIDTIMKEKGITLPQKDASWGQKLFALFEEIVESQLFQPTFITDYPIEVSPLAKRDPANPAIVPRFELFIAGMELSNGFNELNDPFDQAGRFHQQAKARAAGDVEAHYYDADYVLALEYGLPPTVGAAIGIDRLTMLLTNTTSIKDVILFPTLKKKEE